MLSRLYHRTKRSSKGSDDDLSPPASPTLDSLSAHNVKTSKSHSSFVSPLSPPPPQPQSPHEHHQKLQSSPLGSLAACAETGAFVSPAQLASPPPADLFFTPTAGLHASPNSPNDELMNLGRSVFTSAGAIHAAISPDTDSDDIIWDCPVCGRNTKAAFEARLTHVCRASSPKTVSAACPDGGDGAGDGDGDGGGATEAASKAAALPSTSASSQHRKRSQQEQHRGTGLRRAPRQAMGTIPTPPVLPPPTPTPPTSNVDSFSMQTQHHLPLEAKSVDPTVPASGSVTVRAPPVDVAKPHPSCSPPTSEPPSQLLPPTLDRCHQVATAPVEVGMGNNKIQEDNRSDPKAMWATNGAVGTCKKDVLKGSQESGECTSATPKTHEQSSSGGDNLVRTETATISAKTVEVEVDKTTSVLRGKVETVSGKGVSPVTAIDHRGKGQDKKQNGQRPNRSESGSTHRQEQGGEVDREQRKEQQPQRSLKKATTKSLKVKTPTSIAQERLAREKVMLKVLEEAAQEEAHIASEAAAATLAAQRAAAVSAAAIRHSTTLTAPSSAFISDLSCPGPPSSADVSSSSMGSDIMAEAAGVVVEEEAGNATDSVKTSEASGPGIVLIEQGQSNVGSEFGSGGGGGGSSSSEEWGPEQQEAWRQGSWVERVEEFLREHDQRSLLENKDQGEITLPLAPTAAAAATLPVPSVTVSNSPSIGGSNSESESAEKAKGSLEHEKTAASVAKNQLVVEKIEDTLVAVADTSANAAAAAAADVAASGSLESTVPNVVHPLSQDQQQHHVVEEEINLAPPPHLIRQSFPPSSPGLSPALSSAASTPVSTSLVAVSPSNGYSSPYQKPSFETEPPSDKGPAAISPPSTSWLDPRWARRGAIFAAVLPSSAPSSASPSSASTSASSSVSPSLPSEGASSPRQKQQKRRSSSLPKSESPETRQQQRRSFFFGTSPNSKREAKLDDAQPVAESSPPSPPTATTNTTSDSSPSLITSAPVAVVIPDPLSPPQSSFSQSSLTSLVPASPASSSSSSSSSSLKLQLVDLEAELEVAALLAKNAISRDDTISKGRTGSTANGKSLPSTPTRPSRTTAVAPASATGIVGRRARSESPCSGGGNSQELGSQRETKSNSGEIERGGGGCASPLSPLSSGLSGPCGLRAKQRIAAQRIKARAQEAKRLKDSQPQPKEELEAEQHEQHSPPRPAEVASEPTTAAREHEHREEAAAPKKPEKERQRGQGLEEEEQVESLDLDLGPDKRANESLASDHLSPLIKASDAASVNPVSSTGVEVEYVRAATDDVGMLVRNEVGGIDADGVDNVSVPDAPVAAAAATPVAAAVADTFTAGGDTFAASHNKSLNSKQLQEQAPLEQEERQLQQEEQKEQEETITRRLELLDAVLLTDQKARAGAAKLEEQRVETARQAARNLMVSAMNAAFSSSSSSSSSSSQETSVPGKRGVISDDSTSVIGVAGAVSRADIQAAMAVASQAVSEAAAMVVVPAELRAITGETAMEVLRHKLETLFLERKKDEPDIGKLDRPADEITTTADAGSKAQDLLVVTSVEEANRHAGQEKEVSAGDGTTVAFPPTRVLTSTAGSSTAKALKCAAETVPSVAESVPLATEAVISKPEVIASTAETVPQSTSVPLTPMPPKRDPPKDSVDEASGRHSDVVVSSHKKEQAPSSLLVVSSPLETTGVAKETKKSKKKRAKRRVEKVAEVVSNSPVPQVLPSQREKDTDKQVKDTNFDVEEEEAAEAEVERLSQRRMAFLKQAMLHKSKETVESDMKVPQARREDLGASSIVIKGKKTSKLHEKVESIADEPLFASRGVEPAADSRAVLSPPNPQHDRQHEGEQRDQQRPQRQKNRKALAELVERDARKTQTKNAKEAPAIDSGAEKTVLMKMKKKKKTTKKIVENNALFNRFIGDEDKTGSPVIQQAVVLSTATTPLSNDKDRKLKKGAAKTKKESVKTKKAKKTLSTGPPLPTSPPPPDLLSLSRDLSMEDKAASNKAEEDEMKALVASLRAVVKVNVPFTPLTNAVFLPPSDDADNKSSSRSEPNKGCSDVNLPVVAAAAERCHPPMLLSSSAMLPPMKLSPSAATSSGDLHSDGVGSGIRSQPLSSSLSSTVQLPSSIVPKVSLEEATKCGAWLSSWSSLSAQHVKAHCWATLQTQLLILHQRDDGGSTGECSNNIDGAAGSSGSSQSALSFDLSSSLPKSSSFQPPPSMPPPLKFNPPWLPSAEAIARQCLHLAFNEQRRSLLAKACVDAAKGATSTGYVGNGVVDDDGTAAAAAAAAAAASVPETNQQNQQQRHDDVASPLQPSLNTSSLDSNTTKSVVKHDLSSSRKKKRSKSGNRKAKGTSSSKSRPSVACSVFAKSLSELCLSLIVAEVLFQFKVHSLMRRQISTTSASSTVDVVEKGERAGDDEAVASSPSTFKADVVNPRFEQDSPMQDRRDLSGLDVGRRRRKSSCSQTSINQENSGKEGKHNLSRVELSTGTSEEVIATGRRGEECSPTPPLPSALPIQKHGIATVEPNSVVSVWIPPTPLPPPQVPATMPAPPSLIPAAAITPTRSSTRISNKSVVSEASTSSPPTATTTTTFAATTTTNPSRSILSSSVSNAVDVCTVSPLAPSPIRSLRRRGVQTQETAQALQKVSDVSADSNGGGSGGGGSGRGGGSDSGGGGSSGGGGGGGQGVVVPLPTAATPAGGVNLQSFEPPDYRKQQQTHPQEQKPQRFSQRQLQNGISSSRSRRAAVSQDGEAGSRRWASADAVIQVRALAAKAGLDDLAKWCDGLSNRDGTGNAAGDEINEAAPPSAAL